MKANLRKVFLILTLILTVSVAKASDPEDGTIIIAEVENTLNVEVKLAVEAQITIVRLFKLYNPSAYSVTLAATNCNQALSNCFYKQNTDNMPEGVYRIEVYYTGSNAPLAINFMHN
ncbi:MAG: hypothetical protein ACPGVH_03910 [Chitinophagales bacterium]